MAHKLMVCGSRTIVDEQWIFSKLNELFALHKDMVVLSGGAAGVDSIGEKWADLHNVPIEHFLPDWKKYGRSAGPRRNKIMVERADYIICFWDGKSRGTASTVKYTQNCGKPLRIKDISNI